MTKKNQEMAESLARAGYYVFPVTIRLDSKGKKRPLVPGSWKDSTREPGEEFARYDGVIIDCEKSGIVVVDIDEGGAPVLDGLVRLTDRAPMVVNTWSGGEHWYFRQEPDQPIDSHQGVPGPKVDIRGRGGIVFGPGTEVLAEAGPEVLGTYRVTNTAVRVDQLPRMPEALREAIATAQEGRGTPEGSSLAPYTGELSEWQRERLSRWLEEDLDAVRKAVPGERHRALLAYSAKILDRATKLGWPQADAEDAVREAYEESGGDEWADKRAILDWAAQKITDEPLGVPVEPTVAEDESFELLVVAEQRKIQIRKEAQRRAALGETTVDTGRELAFDEPEGSLYQQAWISGLLPKGETVILFGERYHGKSVFALDAALSVASGTSWHGKTVEAGNVLYLAGEGTIGLPARRRAWVQHHRTGNPDRLSMRDRVVQLGHPGSLKAYQDIIEREQIDLVVIDTFRRAARGLEIADPSVAQDMVEYVDDLRRVRHGCTALVLHHPTKTNPSEPAGGGTLQDAVSVIHHLVKDSSGVMTLTTTKMKDGADGEVGRFGLIEAGSSIALVKESELPRPGLDSQQRSMW